MKDSSEYMIRDFVDFLSVEKRHSHNTVLAYRRDITRFFDFLNDKSLINTFAKLDDFDIFTAIKVWTTHKDKVLSTLCCNMVNRQLSRIEMKNSEFSLDYINKIRDLTKKEFSLNENELDYFVYSYPISTDAYNPLLDKINILYKNGEVIDIAETSDQLNISILSKTVTKYFLCYPKSVNIDYNL